MKSSPNISSINSQSNSQPLSSDDSKTSAKEKGKKSVQESERTENIVAITVFILLVILGAAIPTKGFGLFGKSIDYNTRIRVPLNNNDPFKGNNNASIVIIVFSDYSCPNCASGEKTIKSLMNKYPDKIIYVYKNYPLMRIHPNSYNAALAALCAKEQDKFWEYHDYLYEHQGYQAPNYLKSYATELGLDSERFNNCLDSQKYKNQVETDLRTGASVGVTGTPTFFINGIKVIGARPLEEFAQIIEAELKK